MASAIVAAIEAATSQPISSAEMVRMEIVEIVIMQSVKLLPDVSC